MSSNETDKGRRRFLTSATAVVGGLGVGVASIPFIGSWFPSAKAKALGAPVEVDVSRIEPGQKLTVAWRGQPIFIVHRTNKIIEQLSCSSSTTKLRDPESADPMQPDYAQNSLRAINDKYLVVVGLCTHLGCVPIYSPKAGSIDPSWLGGFFCPCHGSKYDLAGRVYKGVPAPTNLPVPPHKYLNDSILLIGED